jgi:hypothetical protein
MKLNRLFEKVLREASGTRLTREVIAKLMASRPGDCFEIWGEGNPSDGWYSYIRKTNEGWDDCVPINDDTIEFVSNEEMKENLEGLVEDDQTVWYIKKISPEEFDENTTDVYGGI